MKTVLILEDMPDQAFIVQHYLKGMKYKTIISYSAYEALQLINKVDIIITDIRMPEMDGLSFIKFVREQMPDIPIIVISAYSDHIVKEEAFRLGTNYYLVKPIEANDLKRIFKQ